MTDITQPPPPPPPSPPPPLPPGSGHPVTVELDRGLEVRNWRPLVNWLLAIPHLAILYGLNAIHEVLVLVSFFAILFTKKIPDGIFRFQVMVMRYQWRVWTYVFFMRNEYPPFNFGMAARDDGSDPARLSIVQAGEYKRWLPLVKWLLVIPHVIVLAFLAIGAVVVWLISFFAVLFTGKYPRGMRDYLVGVTRWSFRVQAYGFSLLTDKYPPFSLR